MKLSHGLTAAVYLVGQTGAVNPIRKVVTMLQNVQKKVEAEGKHEEELFNKFMCYCRTAGGDLEKSIADAEAKIPQLEASIKESVASEAQLKEELAQHQADRTAAKAAMGESTGLREKEAAAYAKFKADTSSDVKAMSKAIGALEKGMGGAFLQTSAAQRLRDVVKQLDDDDQQQVLAFLSAKQDADYAPQSGQIVGILKTQLDEMNAAFAEATSTEQAAIKSYNELMAAKKKEVAASTKAIETKTARVGELAVSIAEQKVDLEDTQEALVEDKKFVADLEKNCDTKAKDWDKIVKTRADEQVALADTIKLLNSDDALELFKKALPGAASSFIQVQETAARVRALDFLQRSKVVKNGMHLDFIALALKGKKVGFEKVLKMIDDMVGLLKTEQADDDEKKEYCNSEQDKLDDEKKGLERSISDTDTAIDDAKESVSSLASEIDALSAGIKALDKSVAEATEQRKEENADFTELLAQDTAAKELLGMAKNRLNKFYNPKLYKEEAQFVEISAHSQGGAAPPPPPEAPGAYSKKSEESNGVIAMLDALVADLDKEMTTAKAEEKDAQADYEKLMEESAEKRKSDSKLVSEKESTKADAQASLEGLAEDKKSASKELAATVKAIQALHGECDFVLRYYDVRKEARTSEIDALTKAHEVLSGAE